MLTKQSFENSFKNHLEEEKCDWEDIGDHEEINTIEVIKTLDTREKKIFLIL